MLLRENSTPLTATSPQPVGDGPAPGEHSSSPREFLRRSAGGMIRVANPLRQSLGWDSRMRPAPKLGIQAWLGHPYAPKQHRSIYRHPDRFWADF